MVTIAEGGWDWNLRRHLNDWEMAEMIRIIGLMENARLSNDVEDSWRWTKSSNDVFLVRTCYQLFGERGEPYNMKEESPIICGR